MPCTKFNLKVGGEVLLGVLGLWGSGGGRVVSLTPTFQHYRYMYVTCGAQGAGALLDIYYVYREFKRYGTCVHV